MAEQSTNKKVAIFLADGCEEIEALTVVDLLYRAGIPHTTVSITDHREVTSSHKVTIIADALISDLNFDEYDMLVLPGGIPGTPNLEACKLLTDKITEFARTGRQVAAICAAPSILANLGLLKGIPATCNPMKEGVLTEQGAILTGHPVTVSGNIITSQAMGTAIPFGLTIVAHYLGKDRADELKRHILFSCATEE